jgi:hypothetical protein
MSSPIYQPARRHLPNSPSMEFLLSEESLQFSITWRSAKSSSPLAIKGTAKFFQRLPSQIMSSVELRPTDWKKNYRRRKSRRELFDIHEFVHNHKYFFTKLFQDLKKNIYKILLLLALLVTPSGCDPH